MAAAADEATMMLVGSVPCFSFGAIDPIAALSDLAVARGIWLHVDACVGGWMAPFAADIGRPIPDFDFRLPGVSSISADLHKFGFCPKPASTIFYRSATLQAAQEFAFDTWPSGRFATQTLVGTRAGGAVAAAWAVLRHLGRDGYRDIARELMALRDSYLERLSSIPGMHVRGAPALANIAYRLRRHRHGRRRHPARRARLGAGNGAHAAQPAPDDVPAPRDGAGTLRRGRRRLRGRGAPLQYPDQADRGHLRMTRVLLATIMHEANSFARVSAPLSHFRRQGIFLDDAVVERFGKTRTEMAGFLKAADAEGWQIVTPIAVPCSPAGPVSAEAFAYFRETLAQGVRDAGKLDGVLLALHGSMVADGEDDGDGALAQAVRDIVGPDVPICISLDPHSNVSDRLAAAVNSISAYRTHPHTDHEQAGLRAAAVLKRTLAGEIDPQVHLARGRQMRGFDSSRTSLPDGPMNRALALARQMEQQDPGVIEVSIQSGYVMADVWQTGPSVAVTGNGRDPRFSALARRLVRFAWDERENDTVVLLDVTGAMAAAHAVPAGKGPIVIADFGDAPGGGGYGDATALLRALLAAPLPNAVFISIADADAVQAAMREGIGGRVKLSLGGHTAPAHGGGPIVETFEVHGFADGKFTHEGPYTPGVIGNFGPSVLLSCNGVRIIVTTFQRNIVDLQQLKMFGIAPEQCGLIALKCMDAFRAAFAPIARAIICCESGGVCSRVHTSLEWQRVRRPIWPLDPAELAEAAMEQDA